MTKYNFNLNYAPHINMFRHLAGIDPFDQIKYIADLGFKHIEDCNFSAPYIPFDLKSWGLSMNQQKPEFLSKLGEAIAKAGLTMGTIPATPPFWPPNDLLASGKTENLEIFKKVCQQCVETQKRLGGKFAIVHVDLYDRTLPIEMQTANIIDAFRYAADIFEEAGMVALIEPVSDHPELFTRTAAQAYLLCRGVNRKSVKVLFDTYHLQRNQGNIIKSLDMIWGEVGYFQIADGAKRTEPTTGEINYKNVLKHIYQKSKADGKDFIIGMKHHVSKEDADGEKAMLKAYAEIDNFL